MYLDLVLAGWIIWGLYGLYRFNHIQWPPVVRPSAKGGTTVVRSRKFDCPHPEVEQVEIGDDGVLGPREVVAKVCTSCLRALPADYSSPGSVIMTTERSVPFHWAEAQERLATGKEVNQCHE